MLPMSGACHGEAGVEAYRVRRGPTKRFFFFFFPNCAPVNPPTRRKRASFDVLFFSCAGEWEGPRSSSFQLGPKGERGTREESIRCFNNVN